MQIAVPASLYDSSQCIGDSGFESRPSHLWNIFSLGQAWARYLNIYKGKGCECSSACNKSISTDWIHCKQHRRFFFKDTNNKV